MKKPIGDMKPGRYTATFLKTYWRKGLMFADVEIPGEGIFTAIVARKYGTQSIMEVREKKGAPK